MLGPIYKKKSFIDTILFILPFTIPKERRLIRSGFSPGVDMMMEIRFALHSAFYVCHSRYHTNHNRQTLFSTVLRLSFMRFPTEASSSSAVRTARDIVADFGENLAELSGGIASLAKTSEKNSERNCHRLMVHRFKLSMPIDHVFLDTNGGPEIPILRFRDWMKMLLQHNCWHLLSGLVRPDEEREASIWTAFWKNFEKQVPQHPIFARARSGEVCLERCVAVVAHGDEGRSKKKSAFLVLNIHSVLGRGIQPGLRKAAKKQYNKMLPNFYGHSYTTRFLFAALPKGDYTGKNSYVFDNLMRNLAEELSYIQLEGFEDTARKKKFWAVCLGMTGDWPWLTKCGNLQRSYSNVSKHADSGGGNRRACGGICHLCRAGQPGVPFEEINTRNPGWKQTVLEQTPFADEIPFEFVPHPPNELPLFFHFDLSHVWHLGVGRNFLGSALALLSGLENGGNVDLRFQQLSNKYLTWCSENGRTAHIQKLTKEHLGWQATTSYPTAGWHKGDLTTSLMLFVQSRFEAERWDGMLRDVGEAAVAINRYITLMFESGAWLEPEQAMEATNHGLRFLRRYNKMAMESLERGQRLWILHPKIHALHHLIVHMQDAADRGPVLNVLCTSVQMDEDFIGRGSRLSRHVASGSTTSLRVVEPYLQAVYAKFIESSYLVRAKE